MEHFRLQVELTGKRPAPIRLDLVKRAPRPAPKPVPIYGPVELFFRNYQMEHLDRQTGSSLAAARLENSAAPSRAAPDQKTVRSSAFALLWLIGYRHAAILTYLSRLIKLSIAGV